MTQTKLVPDVDVISPLVPAEAPRGRRWLRRLLGHPAAWIAAGVLVAGAAFWGFRALGPRVRTVAAERRDLEQHVVASGRVWVPTRVQVSAQTSGLVVAVAVREGERVKRGELLVQLDDAAGRAEVGQAEAAVDQAIARVGQLRRVGAAVANAELRQAQATLDGTKADLGRAERLAASGAVSPVELEVARRAATLARAQRAAAEARQLSAAPQGADTRLVLGALLQARAELVAANVGLAQTKILALQDAVVLARTVEPGDVVQPSRSLLVLAAGGDGAQLVLQADERNLAAIQVGQPARASADAYPGVSFAATVSYLAPSIDPERGSVEVRLLVVDPPAFLKPDMTVSIDLTVAAKQAVLTLPSQAVHAASSSSPWVLVVERGRLTRRDVSLGIRGDGTVEIAAHLDEGAEVVLPGEQLLAAGQRVRAVRE